MKTWTVTKCFHCTDNFQCSDKIQNPDDSFSIQLWTFYEHSHLNIHSIFILNYKRIIFECSPKHSWNVPWMLPCPLGPISPRLLFSLLCKVTFTLLVISVPLWLISRWASGNSTPFALSLRAARVAIMTKSVHYTVLKKTHEPKLTPNSRVICNTWPLT